MKKFGIVFCILLLLGTVGMTLYEVQVATAGALEDAIAKVPQGTGKGQIDPNAPKGYLGIPGVLPPLSW